VGGKRSMGPHMAESPAKKQSKWSPEEDALIIELRGSGMKWEDISKRLPGRSAISCRLHYQNYLERRSEWDEERKNKLARLYERYVPKSTSETSRIGLRRFLTAPKQMIKVLTSR
jgi:Myb-like DNA-binding domain